MRSRGCWTRCTCLLTCTICGLASLRRKVLRFTARTPDPRCGKGPRLRSLLVRGRAEPERRLSGRTGALAREDAAAAGTNGAQTAVPTPGAPVTRPGDE